ncbi:MAG: low molecular weight phosphotyrosine protein phosphatase [Crocinitomicaceae bacterium]|nr:low molecular weight phosphotyrosine protein phosphatase [Crocinitomicaceae bacterium]
MKVLFVCLGNICRSPMAEGIFRDKAAKAGLKIATDSCGTSSHHVGESPDKRAIDCLDSHGVDISDLRARQFDPLDFDHFDLIFTMDSSNHRDILRLADTDEKRQKVKLFLHAAFNTNSAVPDPWYGDDNGFHEVFRMLNEACDVILRKLSAYHR